MSTSVSTAPSYLTAREAKPRRRIAQFLRRTSKWTASMNIETFIWVHEGAATLHRGLDSNRVN